MKIPTSTKEKGTAFEKVHIPEGIYEAELKEIKDVSDGQFGQRVVWIYQVVEKDVELGLLCYKTTATKENKIGKTMIAHGVELNDNEIDISALVGSKVKVWVEDYSYEDEVDGKKVSKTASSISKVKPLAEVEKVKVPSE